MASIKGDLSDFDCVGQFHTKFGLPSVSNDGAHPRLVSQEVAEFRFKFLIEELNELRESYDQGDLPGIADALVDLVYVALGTAHMHGLPWHELFAEVQRANITKERAPSAEASKRGSSLDVIKPPGWTSPNIAKILADHGWKCDGNHAAPECGNPNCWQKE